MDSNDSFLQVLFTQHQAALVRFLKRMLSHDDAIEVAQDAFQKMLKHENPEKLDNARAYLFRIASNLALDHLRRNKVQSHYLQDKMASEDGASIVSPERTMIGQQNLDSVLAIIDELPPKCKRAFLLHRVENRSYAEIARELGVSISMVEKYIIQALKQCRKGLL